MSQLLDSIQNSIPFLRKKKKSKVPVGGFYWEELEKLPIKEASIHCLLKGFVIFCLVFGIINGMFTAFELSYNSVFLFIILLVMSLILSLFHLKKWLFNLGYILTFLNFIMFAISYRIPANSGFQAFINVMTDSFTSYLNMSYEKEYHEILSDRYYTVTVMAVFLGIVMVLVLESLLFYGMHFWPVFLFSSLPLHLCFYVEKYPSGFSLFLVCFSYIAIYLIKKGTHYKYYTYVSKEGYEQVEVNDKAKYSNRHVRSNSKNLLAVCGISSVLALILSIIMTISTQVHSQTYHEPSIAKKSFNPYMELMITQGLSGFFDRYSAKGGLSQGRLGGVSSVSPDYMPDLNVTFVPYSFETVYLKAYTSASYSYNQWLDYKADFTSDSDCLDYCLNQEYYSIHSLVKQGYLPSVSSKMNISNKDANPYHSYLPYITSNADQHTTLGFGDNETISYYPMALSTNNYFKLKYDAIAADQTEAEKQYLKQYKKHINDTFLEIPSTLEDVCKETCDKIGYSDDIYEQACMIRDYFNENYTYSLIPGKTPNSKDFIYYFLKEQNKGYCAHFASAATMLLRSYGIPARYVEGYVITPDTLTEGTVVANESIDDYLIGQSQITNTGVLNVDIPDANAHAWVEIYVEEFGWIPFEFTPSSSDDESYNSFLSMLGRFFMFGGQSKADNTTSNENNGADRFFSSLKNGLAPAMNFFLILIGIAVTVLLIILFRKIIFSIMIRQKAISNGDYSYLIGQEYHKTKQHLQKTNPDLALHYPQDMADYLKKSSIFEIANNANEMIDKVEKTCYSQAVINSREANELIAYFKKIRGMIKKDR